MSVKLGLEDNSYFLDERKRMQARSGGLAHSRSYALLSICTMSSFLQSMRVAGSKVKPEPVAYLSACPLWQGMSPRRTS